MQDRKISVVKLCCAVVAVSLFGLFTSSIQAVPFAYTPISIVPASGVLPDNGCNANGVTVTFDVIDDFTINDVNLGINITHTFRGDLDMNLSSPSVANVILLTDVGGGGDNLNVLFDSDAGAAVPAGTHVLAPDFVNVATPENANALDSFDGQNALGNWVFFVCDDAGVDLGTLTAAELRFDGTLNIATNQVNGTVYKELNNDGVNDPNEIGVVGATVIAYDSTGTVAGTSVTDANGDYVITGLTNTEEYRIEFTNIPNSYQPAVEGANSSTSLTFVTSPASNVDYGVGAPAYYCQADPDLVTSLFRPLDQTTNSALLSFPYSNSGTTATDTEANYNQIGSTWGLAYQSESEILFAAAYLKRHVEFGPGGVGAGDATGSVYRIDNPADGVVSTVSEFLNLNDIIGSNVTGTNSHPNVAVDLLLDSASYASIGKISFGDMDISGDSKDLWVISLANRNLYRLPLGNNPTSPTVPTSGQITAIDMLSTGNYVAGSVPSCTGGNASNFRPFAVKFHQNQVFVGAVCSAEAGGAGLDAHIYSLDTTTLRFREVLVFNLNYNRGCGLDNNGICQGGAGVDSANWNAWSDTYPPVGMITPNTNNADEVSYPQPMIADIEFTNDEQMIIGIRDRWGDQTGHNQQAPDNSGLIRGEGYGDIIRATPNGVTWSFNAVEATGGTEFYSNDSWTDGTFTHFETGFGGLVSLPINGTVTMTHMDPINLGGNASDFAGGVKTFLVADGATDHSYQVYTDPGNNGTTFFGKANGIGDLEALCDTPDQEVGNRVWNDTNVNGIQDVGEAGISGLVVQMIDTDGSTVLGTVTTDTNGEFYFSNATGVDVPGKDFGVNFLSNINNYLFRIDTTQAPLVGLGVTVLGGTGGSSATNDLHDSDAVASGANAEITVITGASGQSNHSYDFGFTLADVADLSLVKNVNNSTPLIGTQVVFTLTVTNDGPSNATNITVVDTVPNGFSGISSISSGGVAVGNVITWSGLNLNNGASIDLTFTVTVDASGVYNNLAEITAVDQTDSDSTPNNGVDTDSDGNTDDDPGDEDDGDGEPVVPVVPGTCVLGNNDIGGIVFRDFNQNGSQDLLEPGFGVAGMIVTAYNAANVVVATANIQADGSYSFMGIAGIDYRIELSGLPDFLEFGVVGAQIQSSVRFINSANCSADFSVNNPVDYCQADPDFIISRFTKEERGGANSAINTILQYNYLDNNIDPPTNISTYQNIGAIYGLAHLRKANVTFASTYFKTHSDIGPAGIGAIYKIDHNTGNSISTFTNLPGTDPRGAAGAAYDWDRDSLAYVNVGKTSIGDIELSDDESMLFAVNMEDRNLYIMDVDNNGNITGTSNVSIPNPCNNVIDYRPMGLGFNDGVLYVGVTCTAESTVFPNDVDDSYFGPRKGNFAELSAHVYSFNPTTLIFGGVPVLDIDLDYQRGCAYDADISNVHSPNCGMINDKDGVARPFVSNWNPWQLDFDIVFNDKNPGNIGNQDTFIEYQQPMLSDIEFDNDGTIIVQIKDINGDRSGHQNLSPATPGDGQLHNGNSYGDILRACGNPTTGWTLESNASCGGVTTGGAGTNEGPAGGEFYWWDNGPGGNGNINGSAAGHSETTMGGLLLVPGHIDIITGVMDPKNDSGIDNGLIWLQNSGIQAGQVSLDAGTPKRLQVSIDGGTSFFGKASGIGDIEALCDPAPAEIGNRIWNDTDGDGIQDADEPGIDGITVTLSCGVDNVSAVTANGGQYYFSNAATVNAGSTQALFMDNGENCQLSVINAQVGLTSFALTLQNADADTSNDSQTDVRDSDASINGPVSEINVTIEAAGHNNHSYDFGYEPVIPLIDFGDAPDTGIGTGVGNYQTTTSDGGPSHIIINSLYMGAGVADSETDGQPNVNASGDDVVGTADEDGPQTILNFASGSTPTVQVLVTNQTGLSATLSGWIDYNGNGVFENGSERTTITVVTGTMSTLVTLNFPIVPVSVPANTVMRLRLGTDAIVLTPIGDSLNGEIEDHRVTLNQDLSGNNQFCYSVADGADRLVTTNPISGAMDDTAAGLGALPFTSIETIAWDLGDPLVPGDEVLYGANVNSLVQLLPTPRATIGTFNNGIIDSDGFAIDWQSTPPIFYGSGSTGSGHLNIFNFNPANANVLNITTEIILPITNTQIDDIAWDPINRRLIGVTNDGTTNSHLVEFDLSNFFTTNIVTAVDCGPIIFNGVVLQDTEGLTFSRPGELFITTGNGGPITTQGGLYKVPVNSITADCTTIVGPAPDVVAERIGPENTLTSITGSDHEAIDCGLTFVETSASIGNRVWLDEDSDGDQEAGEDGIGGVTVYLCRANAAPCNAVSAIRSETTDAYGGYLFKAVPILDYIVAIDTSTVPANLVSNPTYDEDSGTVAPDHQTVVILTQAEEEYLTADFGYNWNESPETETPPPGTAGSIGDRVWIDSDGDGVQDSDESGINSVTINLFTDPDSDGIFDNLIATTTTNANGNYVFDGLVAGAYVVETNPLTLPVGVTWTQTGDPDDFAQTASAADHRTTNPVILAPGDVFINADFGYQGDAANTHVIGDTVYLDANADGNEDSGEPGIANVSVTLLDISANPLAEDITDSNGMYLFSGLPNGVYSVVVTDIQNVLGGLQQSADPDVSLDNRSTVVIAGTDNLNQDFGYTPLRHTVGLGLIGDTIFMDVDGNGVQSVTEPGIEGVTVELIGSSGFPVAITVTNENGHYQFGGLLDDTYTVRVATTTLPNAGVGLSNTADPDGGTANESNNVVIAGGNINLVQDFGYQVNIPNTVGGTIWSDNDADGTQDGSEINEYAGVTVNLLDPAGNIIGMTTTDVNGTYQFIGLPDGVYIISVTDDENVLAGHWLTDGSNPGVDLNSQVVGYSVSVAGGQNNQTGDFGYYVNLARIGDVVYRDDNNDGLRNTLTEPGLPLVPVTLTITYPNSDTVTLTTLTDGAGFYSFERLLADDSFTGDIANGPQPIYSVNVGAVANGYSSTYDGISDIAGIGNGTNNNSDNDKGETAYPVKGTADLSNDFGFVPGATIGNRVWLDLDSDGVQDANEDGIANRVISLTPPASIDIGAGIGNPISAITDTEGNYIFTNLPLANGYTVTVTNPPAGLNQTFDEDGTGTAHTSQVNLTIANEEHLTADFGYIPPDGSIGDFIWSDANGDGQQDPGEIGLAAVTVYLCAVVTNPCNAVSAIATTATDAIGHYLFTGVNLTDIHTVQVDTSTLPAGYILTGDPDNVADSQTNVLALNTSNNINLDADFGYQPTIAANNSDIGDTVYQDLSGDGIEDIGDPGVPGITVQLFVDTTANSIPDTPVASVITDNNGNYLFPSLPNGVAYSVLVTDTNNILNGLTQTGDPDVILDNQSTIAVLLVDNLDQDFGYRPSRKGTGVIGDRIFHDVNANNIQDVSDNGLEGVVVRLFNINSDLIDSVTTDENGNYLFTGLSVSETYSVIVVTSTLPNGGAGWNNNIDPDGTTDAQSVVDLSLSPSGINLDQDFGFLSAVANIIEGTVWQDNDGNGLLTDGTGVDSDETPNGIQNVTVVLTDTNSNIIATTTTDANGDYSFTGLPDGTYIVLVTDDNNELTNLQHTDGPNANDNLIDNNSQDDTGYAVAVSGGQTNVTADFGYKPVVTTPITLASFKAAYSQNRGETTINWSTLTETGNVGFDIFRQVAGIWQKVNEKMIASKHIYKTGLTQYQYSFIGEYTQQWAIIDIDIRGNTQSHGVFNINQLYGEDVEGARPTQWRDIQQLHIEKEDDRNQQKAQDINEYIRLNRNRVNTASGEES